MKNNAGKKTIEQYHQVKNTKEEKKKNPVNVKVELCIPSNNISGN